jgi:membrane protein
MPTTIPPQPSRPRVSLAALAELWYRVAWVACLGFGYGGTYVLAAAIAFYSLVCLGPLGILMAGGLERIFGPGGEAFRHLQVAVRELGGPAADQIMGQVSDLLANPQSHLTSAVSVALLVWSGLRLFETVERSLTGIWPGRRLRGYLRRELVALVMMLMAGVLMAGFILVSATLAVVRARLLHLPHVAPAALAALRFPTLLVLQFLLSVLAFTLVYKFIPVQKVSWRVATRGGLCAAILWQAASPLFLYTLTRSQQQSLLFGGLAGVVIFCLWALLGAWVLLFGAHFAAAYDHIIVKAGPREEDQGLIAGPEGE